MTARPASEAPELLEGEAAEPAATPLPGALAALDHARRGPGAFALAVGLGVAALALFRVELPVISEDAPFRLGVIPLMLAFVLFGGRLGLLASTVALVGAVPRGMDAVLADGIHILEAWTAARLFPRFQSLAFGVMLFWCTAGALLDALGLAFLGRPQAAPVLVFAAQLFSGVVAAFVAEGVLRLVPRRGGGAPARDRIGLRNYFLWWAMWLVVAPGLIVTLAVARITYREQMAEAKAGSQRVLWQAVAAVSHALDAHGRTLKEIAAGIEMALAAEGLPDGAQLDRVRAAHPVFTSLVLRDGSGQVVASSPRFLLAAPPDPVPAPSETRYATAVERGAEGSEPAALRLSMTLKAPDGRPAASIAVALEGAFLADVLAVQRRDAREILSLRAEDGALIASTDPGGARPAGAAARDVVLQPIAWLRWTVALDQPLSEVQGGARNAIARLLGAFLAMVALLQIATSVLARKVATPLARMDRAASALESGGPVGAALLDDLAGSPIAEVHSLATRFAGMHEALAYHDSLTGLPNEKLLLDRLSVAVAQAAEPPSSFTLLLVDLDRFRVIDSTLGHALANDVLRKVARRLQDCVRIGDTVARVGGDEFALLLPRVGRMENATEIALKVMEAVKRPFLVAGQDVFVTASVGISLYPRDGFDSETLLKNAVAAAYVAKEQGQDSYRRYTARIKVRDAQRLLIETGLRRALEGDGLFLQYQPIVDLGTGEMLAAEALVRWRREDVGVVEAAAFIPVAEASGLITAIDLWVVRTACAQAAAWRSAGHEMRVAVNLSARQVREPDMVEQVRHALERSGLDPRLLEIEITEGVALREVEQSAEVLGELRRLGVSISVDDFGTGYSSLSFLRRLPVDRVKLDRSFVQDVTRNADDAAIATAVIAMSHGLRLTVVAEGVETDEQLAFLRRHDCDAIQGRLFSPPVSAEELEALVRQGCRLARG